MVVVVGHISSPFRLYGLSFHGKTFRSVINGSSLGFVYVTRSLPVSLSSPLCRVKVVCSDPLLLSSLFYSSFLSVCLSLSLSPALLKIKCTCKLFS